MSDPVTNVDVEDVLSSIRRLVSDTNSDTRGGAASPSISEADAAGPKPTADALILTSALRVDASEAAPENAAEGAEQADMSNLRSTLDEVGAGEDVPEDAAPWPPESNHADWPAPADGDYYEDDETSEGAPVIDFIRHGKTAVINREEDASESSDSDDANEESDQDWAVEEQPSHDNAPESDIIEAEDTDVEGTDTDETQDDRDEAMEAASSEDESSADHGDEQDTVDHEDAAEDLAEEVVFASAAAASVMNDDASLGEDAAEVDLGDFDESIIDEDALRDLVAEIVRQELTGDLGERITRNVRKLVRREIHRALLTREFE